MGLGSTRLKLSREMRELEPALSQQTACPEIYNVREARSLWERESFNTQLVANSRRGAGEKRAKGREGVQQTMKMKKLQKMKKNKKTTQKVEARFECA